MQKMVVGRLVAARRDETCALSVPPVHGRSPLAFSQAHTNPGAAAAARAPRLAPPPRVPPLPPPPEPAAAGAPRRPPRPLPPRAARPPLGRLHPRSAHRSAPVSPTLPRRSGNRFVCFFFLPSPHFTDSLLSSSSVRRGTYSGDGQPQRPCLCFPSASASRLHWAGNGPAGPGLHPRSGARGVSASPGPRPPAAFLQARGEDRQPPAPAAVAARSASPSAATGLRAGDSGPRCSKAFSSANSPGIWKARDGNRGGEGAQGGRGREKAVKAGRGGRRSRSRRLGRRRKELEAVRVGQSPREVETS